MSECIETINLINDAISGNKSAHKALFDECRSTLEDFFCLKIFNKIPEEKSQLDGLGDLCKKIFSKTWDEIVKKRKIIESKDFDLKRHCLRTAEENWKSLVNKLKSCDKTALNTLFLICQKRLLGYLRGRVWHEGPTVEPEELLQDAYIIACNKQHDYPYDPAEDEKYKSPYYYIHYLSDASFLAKRSKTISDLKGRKNDKDSEKIGIRYRHPKERTITSFIANQKDEDNWQHRLDRLSQIKEFDPEKIMATTELIEEKINEEKRLFTIKLTALEFCAYCSKPHQFLAFGFNKWLNSNPRNIVQSHSFTQFSPLSQELIDKTTEMIKDIGLLNEQEFIEKVNPRRSFVPLLDKLEKSTRQIYKDDENKSLVSHYGSSVIKNLSFSIFYEEDKSRVPDENWGNWSETQKKKYQKKISDWTDKVRKSTMNGLTLRKRGN